MPPPGENARIDEAVELVRKGDSLAFEQLVRTFERPLRSWLAAVAAPGVDVDELAQESFVAAYCRLNEYKAGTDFGAWLFTIARYKLLTEATRLRRIADYNARYALNLLERELERRRSEPPELAERRLECLRKCLAMLDEHLRSFIAWRYEEGIPLEEMASRSGRSVAAVKKQLGKIRHALQQCIGKHMAIDD
jgi:RNA polymerase sigma-70 factor, ECF subfamily